MRLNIFKIPTIIFMFPFSLEAQSLNEASSQQEAHPKESPQRYLELLKSVHDFEEVFDNSQLGGIAYE